MRLGEGGSESETSELSSIIFVQPGDVRYYTLARNIDGGIQLDILILMTLCCTTKKIFSGCGSDDCLYPETQLNTKLISSTNVAPVLSVHIRK